MIITLLLILLVINNQIDKNYFYPSFLYNLIWFFILSLHHLVRALNLIEIDSLNIYTELYVLFSVISFSTGSIVIKILNKKISKIKEQKSIYKLKYDNILFYISIFGLLLFINKAFQIVSVSSNEHFLIALRTELNYNNQGYGWISYFVTIGIFNATSRILSFNTKSDKIKLVISYVIATLFCILTTGRTFFLLLLILTIGLLAIRNKISLKKIFYSLIIMLFIFIIMGSALQKNQLNSILMYSLGPISAFNNTFNNVSSNYFGEHTLRFFYIITNNTGITNVKTVDLIRPYSEIPFKINVYTAFSNYISDFGIIISLIIIFFIGSIHTILFEFSKYKNATYKYLSALSNYPLIMVFFQDQYFSLLSTWIQFIILSFIILYPYKINK